MFSDSEEEGSWLGSEDSSSEELRSAHYRVLKDIGEGGFGEVKLAQHLPTQTPVAVKIIPKTKNNDILNTEMDLMRSLDHPNVIKLYEILETDDLVYLVLEYAPGGDLQDLVDTVGGLWEDEARSLFRQVAGAMRYCHELGIAHRDLKLSNVLLDAQGRPKVCDFGLGARCLEGHKLRSACGTLPFCAPEILMPGPKSYDGPKADVWSLGVLLYHLVVGRPPFRGVTQAQVEKAMLGGELGFPAHVSSDFRDLLGAMVAADPARRPSLGRVLEHPWLQQGPREPPAPPGLPPRPDSSILEAMAALGYDPQQVREALSAKSYNGLMGAYLMLEQRKSERGERGGLARSPRPSVAPGGPWSSRVPSAGASAPALQPPPFPGKDARGGVLAVYLATTIGVLPRRASQPRPAPAPDDDALRDAEAGGRHEEDPAAVRPEVPAAPPASPPAARSRRLRSCPAWLRGLCPCRILTRGKLAAASTHIPAGQLATDTGSPTAAPASGASVLHRGAGACLEEPIPVDRASGTPTSPRTPALRQHSCVRPMEDPASPGLFHPHLPQLLPEGKSKCWESPPLPGCADRHHDY
ncbi:sperm motility kinase Z-like [Perognathus longimembris pacificus]|uniref:sperm motility kinase Z-like n=1 Tax=Perognathus longimembris pacificus TaxID=214514 RepID=UPI002018D9EA|nr:sperm motility kinase Z-like [Perognathus longimembris pacificus]